MSNSHANWLRRAAEEIAKVGHYGWGNTCEDAAEHIDALEAELAALRAQEAKYQKAIEYAEECFRDAESRANEATVELAAARERADRTEAGCRDCTIALTVWSQRAEKAEAEAARLRAALAEAIDDVQDWAGYASEYFREKHDLAGNLARLRAALGERMEGRQ